MFNFLMIVAQLYVAFFITSIVHECGHFIGALIMRETVIEIVIFRWISKPILSIGKVKIGWLPHSSYVLLEKQSTSILVNAGGLIFNILFCIAAFKFWHIQFVKLTIILNLASASFNALPIKGLDGWLLFKRRSIMLK